MRGRPDLEVVPRIARALIPVVVTIVALEVSRRQGVELPGGVLHLVAITLAAVLGGLPGALAGAAVAVAHGYVYLTAPGHAYQIHTSGLMRARMLLVAGPLLAVIAGLLKRRAETALAALAETNRALSSEIAAKTALAAEHRELLEKQQRFAEDMLALGETSSTLQICETTEEASELLSRSLGALFPECRGAVYLLTPSQDRAVSMSQWGAPELPAEFLADQCWALRRVRVHRTEASSNELPCFHVEDPSHLGLCFPLTGKGGLLGVLHVDVASPEGSARVEQIARLVADHLALGLENLALRQRLTVQALRDPLTGLLNRWAMLDVLDREMRRAQRKKRPLSVVMLDVDHFKRFNDTHGHAAGDAALRELGRHIGSFFRADDVVCRYGGEEIVAILPEADPANAGARAEAFRKSVETLSLSLGSEALPGITVSIGVASFPDHASSIDDLLRRADEALYRAKHAGRNRICSSGSGEFDAVRAVGPRLHARR